MPTRPHRALPVAILLLAFMAAPTLARDLDNDTCMTCHDDEDLSNGKVVDLEAFQGSAHGQGEMTCTDCHMDIEKVPHKKDLIDVSCMVCHRDVRPVYESSIHAKVNKVTGTAEAASCADCHGVHDARGPSDPKSSVHHHNLASTCIKCHEDQALIERHETMPRAKYIQSYVLSVHGRSNRDDATSQAATCNNCHGWHDTKAKGSPDSPVSRTRVVDTCGRCHKDVVKVYFESVHGRLAKEGNPDVPVCTDCHGEHRIRSHDDRQSTVSRFKISETCARCHEDPRIVEKYNIPVATPSTFYAKSVHGKALLSGKNATAAACQDCHGHHSILGGYDDRSRVHRKNIPETCGSCHQHADILATYERSVHGKAMRRGVRESPVCTDCHGEHTILGHLDPESPVYPTRLAKEVCGRCHDSVVINRKYGLSQGQVSTYYESYHGLASQLGDTAAANCASCHGVHDILRSDDPESSIHEDNLLTTCGKCHLGASREFVTGLVHVSSVSRENPVLWWLRRIYVIMIVVLIGSMLLHNFLIMFRHIRDKFHKQRAVPYVVRFPRTALIQHLLLSVSFTMLVITGFSLSYPESLFSRFMGETLGFSETGRSTVHRVSAVGMTLTVIWHAIVMIGTRRGRQEIRALLPRLQDVKDLIVSTKYHLGLSNVKPRYDRYDYSEKMEYWALMWGAVLMAATGLLMWFSVEAAAWFGLGKPWVDASNVVHFYEAWLATLAIAIWHFFFVLFHPEEYPMALSWLTGRLPVHSMEERHPRELERLRAEGRIVVPGDEDSSGENSRGAASS